MGWAAASVVSRPRARLRWRRRIATIARSTAAADTSLRSTTVMLSSDKCMS